MLLTLSLTQAPATDLGYLLHKNPARAQAFTLSFGRAHVFYPEAEASICTAALLLEIDPVAIVRGRRGPAGEGRALEQYVNDRPYAASSFLSVAIAQVYGSALAGRSKERPELAATALPFQAQLPVLPCRGWNTLLGAKAAPAGEPYSTSGEEFLRRLFEPLGYAVTVRRLALDEQFPDWGESAYYAAELEAEIRLRDLLSHLYVLVPVLDNDKHYWVGDDEVEKLLRHGAGWLATHPERELIASRYMKHRRTLAREALARLFQEENPDPDRTEEAHAAEEAEVERRVSLNEQRLGAVQAALKACGARRVLDLGCGEGRLIEVLLREPVFEEIVGLDVSYRSLEVARDRLRLDRLPEKQRQRVKLMQGSLTYRDQRLTGYDAAAVVEVIEHLDPPRLAAFERVLFEFARPDHVVMTTPNAEYNVRFPSLPAGRFRHKDHRFEWTRVEFQAWAIGVAARFGYTARFLPVGPEDPEVGSPTQMAVFSRSSVN